MPLTVGHGKSDWRKSGMYHVIDNVADAVYAADALKWDKFSMCIARPFSVLFTFFLGPFTGDICICIGLRLRMSRTRILSDVLFRVAESATHWVEV